MRKVAKILAKSSYLLSAVLSAGLGFCSSGSLAAPNLSDAIRTYDSGDYAAAVNMLTAATAANLTDSALAHYYLARALLMNRHLETARGEYLAAYGLDKSGAVGKLCLDALKSIAPEEAKRNDYAHILTSATEAVVGLSLIHI